MLTITLNQENDQRWIAKIETLPRVLTYGQTKEEAIANVKALALRVLADRVERGESIPEAISFVVQR